MKHPTMHVALQSYNEIYGIEAYFLEADKCTVNICGSHPGVIGW